MTYTYEDMMTLPLPPDVGREILDAVRARYGLPLAALARYESGESSCEYMQHAYETLFVTVRDKPEYLLADDIREKATAAFSGPSEESLRYLFDVWSKKTATYTKLEKIFWGWSKV